MPSGGGYNIIAIANVNRSTSFPDVPTVAEAGMPDLIIPGIYGLYVPAGTPPEIVEKLNAAIATAVSHPEMKEKFAQLGLTFKPRSSAEFAEYIRTEIERWRQVAQEAGIPPLD